MTSSAPEAEPGRTAAPQPARRGALSVWGAAVALALFAFGITLDDPLGHLDDNLYILDRARILDPSLGALLALWSPGDALTGRFVEFFPLRDSVYWLLHRLFGVSPWPYHFVNILLHGTAGALVFAVARKLDVGRWGAALAAALFIVHPVQVESVAWVAALKNPLAGALMLGATWCWLDDDGSQGVVRATVLLALGLLVKSMLITLAPSLLLVDVLWRRRDPLRTLLRLAPLIVLTAGALIFFLQVGAANDVIAEYPGGSMATGWMSSVRTLGAYALKALFPVGLNAWYVMPPVLSPADPRFIAPLLAVALFALLVVRLGGARRRLWALLAASYVVSLLPVLNIVPFPIEMADRYQYSPLMIACVIVGALLDPLLAGARARLARPVAGAVILVLLGATWMQASLWGDPLALWREVAAQEGAEDYPHIQNAVAAHLRARGEHEQARGWLERAVNAGEDRPAKVPALANLARTVEQEGDLARAEALWGRLLQLDAGAPALLQAAAFEQRRGRFAASAAILERAVNKRPASAQLWFYLGLDRYRAGLVDEATQALLESVRLEPQRCPTVHAFLDDMAGTTPDRAEAVRAGIAPRCLRQRP